MEYVKNITSGSKHYGEIAKIIDYIDNMRISVKYTDGHVGKGRIGKHYQYVDSSEKLSSNKTNKVSFLKKVKNLLMSEPEKTYRKLGLKDVEGNLTEDVKEFLINVLWEANEATLVREKATAVLADADKKDK